MPNTFELIASSTVGAGGAASIDFTSIPSTFTDLCIVASLRSINADVTDDLYLRINGSTTASTSFRQILGTGSAASSQNGTSTNGLIYVGLMDGATATASTFSSNQIYIPNYAGSTNKSISTENVQEANTTAAYMSMNASLWSSTAAINRVTLIPGLNNLAQHSTAYLYGVKNA